MTRIEFIERLENYLPDGYTLYASFSKDAYNQEKQIEDTLLLVLPREWPVHWRAGCSNDVEVTLWFGKVVDVKKDGTGTQQHGTYEAVDLADAMNLTAAEFITSINADDYISVLTPEPVGSFYPSPDGKSVNRQMWLSVPLTVRLYAATTIDYTYVTFSGDYVTFSSDFVTN